MCYFVVQASFNHLSGSLSSLFHPNRLPQMARPSLSLVSLGHFQAEYPGCCDDTEKVFRCFMESDHISRDSFVSCRSGLVCF